MTTDTPPLALSARNIHKSYGEKEILRGISVDVRKGEHIAIIGPSGSGKSTFIRCLNALEVPDAGTIDLRGERVFDAERRTPVASVRELRKRVGMVFQSFNLFATQTALENVSLAQRRVLGRSKEEAAQRSEELLERVGLREHTHKLPRQLSGGQQQRVAIARSLALDPEVILFDEPTSAIDPEMRVEVLKVMKELAEGGMTMLMVTHEIQFAREAADRVMFIADGEVIGLDTPEAMLVDPAHERVRRFVNALSGVV
ncbi:amino acid ABC transporter ATP-binding protein [Leucobacter luti]|uniref:Amino acid ABC transporter ATP-binding protein (PAAT family) n=1 Tax=Leucobacter luti TaxID=340320 RepID=A0A4Q7U795_9MICO|nr:amino acid ABC transporter ATP-binding protein [Leucobacter luti]MBL3700711.1 amino acid ABC transporter ATP-binding protein [Leucobacter luti]RZT68448.1 amino acid ABC transporter ATP-binding protein (PAAT family) [Leucobacter luti]